MIRIAVEERRREKLGYLLVHAMARQKMHCSLRRTHSNTQKVSDGGKDSLLRKSLEQNNFRTSSEDREISSLVWTKSNHRCAFLTFITLEPDGHWRIVAIPVQCSDHSNHLGSVARVKKDGLHLVFPPPISSFKVHRQKTQRGPPPDCSCSVKSFEARSSSGSNLQRQSQNKGLAKKTNQSNEFSSNSCQNSFTCSDFSNLVPSGSNATNSSDMFIDSSKVDKATKRNSRKKARKKGKQSKKLSCDSGSTELEVLSEEYSHASLTSETCANNDMDHGDGPVSYATALEDSLPEYRINTNEFEGDRNGIINCSETPKTCASYIDEVDECKTIISSLVQSFTDVHPVSNPENGTQTEGLGFSIINGEVEDTHCKQIICYDDMYSKGIPDTQDSPVLDSVYVGWNSDDNSNAGYDVKASEGTNCGSLGCSSTDMQLIVPGKRGKQVKKVPRSSSVYRRRSNGNSHGRTGKENNHSVWQKVQKNGADECNCELKKVSSVCSQFDVTLKEAPLLKRNYNVVESNILLKSEDKNQIKVKVARKLKRKTSLRSKQVYNCYSRKGSHAIKASSNVRTKINLQQNEILDIPAQVIDQKGLRSVTRSHYQLGCPRFGLQTNGVECITSEPVYSSQVCPDKLERLESVCNVVSIKNVQTTEVQNSSLSKSCDSSDQSNLLEAQSPVYLHPLVGNEIAEVEREVSPAENGKQDHSSGSILQRWIPIGIRDPGLNSLGRSDISSLAHSNEQAAEGWTVKNIVVEESASNSDNHVSSVNAGVMCKGQSSGNVDCSPDDEGQIQKLRHQNTCTSKEHNNNHAAANSVPHESKRNISAFETDSIKIAQAVNDACRVQLASEAVRMATGNPIAEFERFLHSASPVICQSHNFISCQTCSRAQVVGAALCRHEAPNISLGSMWQWYEKNGSYGLEVRAEDYENSKRLGVHRLPFRAYFVPFLSAVQLFRLRKSHPNRNGISSPEILEACEMGETSEKSSNISGLPIFPILVPRPCTEDTSSESLVSQVCSSELSLVSSKDDVSVQSADTTWSDDLELLFEYFEFEQPQQRRPLFQKIKELVRGDGPSQCKAYGDPTKLVSMDLHDLHPRSWYSVAWYPIYRIPDGNFRAAFLTYHSLGHLVHRSATFDSPTVDSCIVSPVVGLQSYNAQGECWFQPRHSALDQSAETSSLNPSGILKERLRTLEQTASLMARAVVSKGNLTSVNRQSDYEFFLSRRRY